MAADFDIVYFNDILFFVGHGGLEVSVSVGLGSSVTLKIPAAMEAAPYQSPKNTPASASRQPALGFIFVTLFLDILGIGIVVPILAKLVETLHGGGTDAAAPIYGLMVAVYCLMQFLCAPLLGSLSDQVGRRPVILVALFGAGLDYFLLAWAPSLGWFFVGRVIAGMTGANFSAATAYIADVSPPEKRAANFGLVGAAFGLGFIVGPAIGGLLGEYSLRLPFIVAGSITLLNWLYGYIVLPESLAAKNRRKFSWRAANPVASLKGLGRSPLILGLAVSVFLLNVAHYVYQSVWVLYTGYRYGWGPREVGISLVVVGIMSALVQGVLARKILPKLGERKAMMIGLVVMLVEMVGFGMAWEAWQLYALIIFGSLGGLAGPAMQGLMSRSVGDDEQGWIQGAITSLSSLAGIFAPPVLTMILAFFIADSMPRPIPGAPFFFSAVLMAAAVLVALRVARGAKLKESGGV